MIRDIFFDLDHTLWDFEANAESAYGECFEEMNIPLDVGDFMRVYRPLNREFWKRYREGEVTKEELQYGRLTESFKKMGYLPDDGQVAMLISLFLKYLPTYNRLFDGAGALLEKLSVRYRLHIITNGFDEVQLPKLRHAGIGEYFHTILTAEQAGVKKPEPLIFHKALEKSGAELETSIMVGDSYEADILGAVNVGMRAVLFDPNNVFPGVYTPTIRHLSELNEILRDY